MDGLVFFIVAIILAVTTKKTIIESDKDERQILINTTGFHDEEAFMKHYNIIVMANNGLSRR